MSDLTDLIVAGPAGATQAAPAGSFQAGPSAEGAETIQESSGGNDISTVFLKELARLSNIHQSGSAWLTDITEHLALRAESCVELDIGHVINTNG